MKTLVKLSAWCGGGGGDGGCGCGGGGGGGDVDVCGEKEEGAKYEEGKRITNSSSAHKNIVMCGLIFYCTASDQQGEWRERLMTHEAGEKRKKKTQINSIWGTV